MTDERSLRERIHKLGNLLFKITLAAGTSKEALKEIVAAHPEVKATPQVSEISKALEDIEKTAMQLDEHLSEIKEYAYMHIDPDTPIP